MASSLRLILILAVVLHITCVLKFSDAADDDDDLDDEDENDDDDKNAEAAIREAQVATQPAVTQPVATQPVLPTEQASTDSVDTSTSTTVWATDTGPPTTLGMTSATSTTSSREPTTSSLWTSSVVPTTSTTATCNNCVNGGICTSIGGGFHCSCPNQFTGLTCESVIGPETCIPESCVTGAQCIDTPTGPYCVCPGNSRGPNCQQIDNPVQCSAAVSKKFYNLATQGTGPVDCFSSANTDQQSDICSDPDDALVYSIADPATVTFNATLNAATSTAPFNLTYLASSGRFCLNVDPNMIQAGTYCIRLLATEIDDVQYRPWRNASHDYCIMFNAPPRLVGDPITMTANISELKQGVIVFDFDYTDEFVFSTIQFSITNVSPPAWGNYFSMDASTGIMTVVADILSPVDKYVNVGIGVKIEDGGIPPLSFTGSVVLTVLNGSLSCSTPPLLYIGIRAIPNGQTVLGTVQCTGVTNDVIGFSINNAQDLLVINTQGDLFLGNLSSNGNFSIQVMAYQAPFPSVAMVIYVSVGDFAPNCFPTVNHVLEISEQSVLNSCYHAYQCNSPLFGGDIGCNVATADPLGSYVELGCSLSSQIINHYIFNVSVCIYRSLAQQNKLGQNVVQTQIYNDYGTEDVSVNVQILPGNFNPPIFIPASFSTEIQEYTANGTNLIQLTAIDADVNDVLTFSMSRQDVPFTVSGVTLKVNGILNATYENLYVLTVLVSDLVGHLDTATVTVGILDVNEPPKCFPPYNFVVDATATSGQTVAQLTCYDSDRKTEFRTFSYHLSPDASSTVRGLFSISPTGRISLLQDMTAAFDSYSFIILATDGGGSTTSILVMLIVNRYFSPVCPQGVIPVTVKDDQGPSNCFSVNTGCTDPLGGRLTYNINGGNGSQIFMVQPVLSFETGDDESSNSLILCPLQMLTHQLGNWHLHVDVNNPFNMTSFLLVVTVEEKNDRPVFVGPGLLASISEKIPIGNIFLQTSALDADILSINNQLVFSLDLGGMDGFAITSDTGMISTTKVFNATTQSLYQFTVKVEDPQGLSDETQVVVDIQDVNEPPQCDPLSGPIRVNLTTPLGTVIGAVNCWDGDLLPDNKKIVYTLEGPLEQYLLIGDDGTIKLGQALPRTSTTMYSVTLNVYDQFMLTNNSLSGYVTLTFTVLVNTNIPPVCSQTSIPATLLETDDPGTCVGQEVICEDPTGGAVTVLTSQGNGLDVAEIKSRASDTTSQLPLIVCTTSSLKKLIQDFSVSAVVSNGFGDQSVVWTFSVEDVNEAPFFLSSLFNVTVLETTAISTSVLTLEISDPDINPVYKDVKVTYNMVNVPDVGVPIHFLLDCCFLVTGKLNATLQDLYQFNITLTDGGGLTHSQVVSISIADQNEAPVCSPTTMTESISLLTQVDEVIGQLSCYDYDKDPNNKKINYQSSLDYFRVSNAGELIVNRTLVRSMALYTVVVTVQDMGMPPLSTAVTVQVNVNTAIPVDCQTTVLYPNVWVKGQCVTLIMHCIDPTMPGQTSHLSYSQTGNYTLGFIVIQSPVGQYKLCYDLLASGSFGIAVTVYNGLAYYTHDQPLDVKYDQSNPVFTNVVYTVSVPETMQIGSPVTTVTASTASTSGSIVYSITGGSWSNVTSIFRLDSTSGIITTRVGLRTYATQTITLEIQALNDFSLLRSTATVEVTVTDVNEVPSCMYQDGVQGDMVTVTVDDPVATPVLHIQCIDHDVDMANKQLTAVLTYIPSISGVFVLKEDNGQYMVETSTLLPVQTAFYDVTLVISDAATPPLSVQILRRVIVVLLPPAPVFYVAPINSTVAKVTWWYERAAYYAITTQFVLAAISGDDQHVFVTQPDPDVTQLLITKLVAETEYKVELISVTNYGNVSSAPVTLVMPAIPILSNFMMSLRLPGQQFLHNLLDTNSYDFVTLKRYVEENMDLVLKKIAGYMSVGVVSFREGSVIVDTMVTVNQWGTRESVSNGFQAVMQTGWVGNMSVDPQYFVTKSGDGYIRITEFLLNTTHIYNNIDVAFSCSADVIGMVGDVQSRWTFNGSVIEPGVSSRWQITDPNPTTPSQRHYKLVISPIVTYDMGNYECEVYDDTGLTSKASLMVVVIAQPQLIIYPHVRTVVSGQSVNMTCQIIQPLSYFAFFTWYRNGASITNSAGIQVLHISSFKETLVVSQVTVNAQYGCEATNVAGTGPRVTMQVTARQAAAHVCSPVMDGDGTVWEETVAGGEDIQNCPTDMEGTASRTCTSQGLWAPPDYSLCIRTDLSDLETQTGIMKEGVGITSPEDSLVLLSSITGQGVSLSVGDTDACVNILGNVVSVSDRDNNLVTTNAIEAFASSTNNLLEDVNKPAWMLQKERKRRGVSGLLEIATAFGKVGTKLGDTSQDFNQQVSKSNLVLNVGRSEPKDIVFPDRDLATLPNWIKDSTTKGVIRKDTISRSLGGAAKIGYSGIYYRNISNLMYTYLKSDGNVDDASDTYDVNSDVLDINIVPASTILNPPLELTFEHFSTNYSTPLCVFWDFTVLSTPSGAWSDQGCKMVSTTDTSTTCTCDHVTNFALLMSPGKTPVQHALALSIISAIGCAFSMLFLCITIMVYGCYWRYVRSDRATILMHLCVALVAAYLLFLVGINRTENKDVCTAFAAILHYIFLVVFFLMLAEGIEVAFTVLYVFSTRSRIRWLIPLAWLIPAVIVGISMGATKLEGYGNSLFCWLSVSSASGVLWAFIGPVIIIIVVNAVILFLVIRALFNTHTMMTKSAREQAKTAMRSLCVLLPVMGVAWIFGVFSVNEDLVLFQYLFAIFNSLQGFLIFLFHCFLNRQIKDAINHSRRRKRSMADLGTKSSSQSTNQKAPQKDLLDPKQNNMEPIKKENPFLEADRQVQQIVDKLLSVDNLNAYDGENKQKNIDKDIIVSLEDVKITNLFQDSDFTSGDQSGAVSSSEHSGAVSSSSTSRHTSASKTHSDPTGGNIPRRGTYDQLDPSRKDSYHKYEKMDSAQGSGSDRDRHRPVAGQMSQPIQHSDYSQYQNSSKNPYYNPHLSPASSSTKFSSSNTRSTIVDPYSSSDMEFPERHYVTRLENVPVYSQEPKKKVQKKKSKEVDAHQVQQDMYGMPQPTYEKHKRAFPIPHWGKPKPSPSDLYQQQQQAKQPKQTRRQRERAQAYAVDSSYPSTPTHQPYRQVQPQYPQPQSRHQSLENISMQYMGVQPHGALRPYDNVRYGDRRDYPTSWHEPYADYW